MPNHRSPPASTSPTGRIHTCWWTSRLAHRRSLRNEECGGEDVDDVMLARSSMLLTSQKIYFQNP